MKTLPLIPFALSLLSLVAAGPFESSAKQPETKADDTHMTSMETLFVTFTRPSRSALSTRMAESRFTGSSATPETVSSTTQLANSPTNVASPTPQPICDEECRKSEQPGGKQMMTIVLLLLIGLPFGLTLAVLVLVLVIDHKKDISAWFKLRFRLERHSERRESRRPPEDSQRGIEMEDLSFQAGPRHQSTANPNEGQPEREDEVRGIAGATSMRSSVYSVEGQHRDTSPVRASFVPSTPVALPRRSRQSRSLTRPAAPQQGFEQAELQHLRQIAGERCVVRQMPTGYLPPEQDTFVGHWDRS